MAPQWVGPDTYWLSAPYISNCRGITTGFIISAFLRFHSFSFLARPSFALSVAQETFHQNWRHAQQKLSKWNWTLCSLLGPCCGEKWAAKGEKGEKEAWEVGSWYVHWSSVWHSVRQKQTLSNLSSFSSAVSFHLCPSGIAEWPRLRRGGGLAVSRRL